MLMIMTVRWDYFFLRRGPSRPVVPIAPHVCERLPRSPRALRCRKKYLGAARAIPVGVNALKVRGGSGRGGLTRVNARFWIAIRV